ncbi:MAG: glycosyltransferase family 4 protein [Planctomycetes bacterium]|nr:glycosyltransferase family 4 protein [Planctomycetota bacterium]
MTTFISANNDARPRKVGYVLKRYPRFSETFVVNEILAHEAAGLAIEVFALRPNTDTHFQHAIADVRAPINHLRYGGIKAETLWCEIDAFAREFPEKSNLLSDATGYPAVEVFQALLLARKIRERGIEHLHAHFGTTAAGVARLASLLTDVPYTFTAHAKDIFHEYVDEEMLGRKIADAAAVVTVSDFNVDDLSERFPQSSDKIRRIYNGLPLDKYLYSPPTNRPAKIVAVGRLVEKKGFNDLIDACALLKKTHVNFECTIIGGGDLEGSLRSQIQQLNLAECVTLAGPLPQQEVHKTIREAAVCVAPCITASTGDRDGLPTVLLESMALGTPCVSTAVTGIPEIIRDEETGLLVPEREPSKLAEAMQRLLGDEPLRVRLAAAARELFERDFSIEANTYQMREVFGQCQPHLAQQPLAEVG